LRRSNATLALLAFVLTACPAKQAARHAQSTPSETPKRGGTLRVLLADDVDSLDPNRATTPRAWFFTRAIARGLLAYPSATAPAGADPIPDLASGPPSVSTNGLTYTFTLRDDARFGAPVNRAVRPADVVASIQRLAFTGAGIAPFLSDVAETRTKGAHSVVLHLRKPMPDLPWILAQPQAAIVPAGTPEAVPPTSIAPSGPYRLVSYEPERSIMLVRNPAWAASSDPVRSAYVDRISASIGVAPADAFKKVARGDAELVLDEGPPDQHAGTRSFPIGADVTRAGNGCVRYLFVNLAVPPFGSANARLAVASSVQRARFVGGEPGDSPAPRLLPPIVDGNSTARVVAESLRGARTFLKRAHLPRGFHTTLIVGNSPRDRVESSILRASLARAHIAVTIRRVSPAELYPLYYEKVSARVPMGIATWCADWPGLAGRDVLGTIAGTAGYSHVRTARLARAIATAEVVQPDRAAAAWAAADARAVGTGALVPLSWPVEEVVTSKDLRGLLSSPMWTHGDPTELWLR
jgi:peptide/nickel transport system substrate-binding protein